MPAQDDDASPPPLPQRRAKSRRRAVDESHVAAIHDDTSGVPLQEEEANGHVGHCPAGAPAASQSKSSGPQMQPELLSSAQESYKFEYLDHTADIQLHAWGGSLEEAFSNVGLAMYNYMTPLSGVSVDESMTRVFEASGHDLPSLLYAFLDELLFVFATELFVCCQLRVEELDQEGWSIRAVGRGEAFVRGQHEMGTEVKAITYSAMQITETPEGAEIFVIVDI